MSRRGVALALCSFLLLALPVTAQKNSKNDTKKAEQEARDAKEKQQKAQKLTKEQQKSRQAEEGGKELKRWLNEDVAYIITDEERAAFNRLKTDDERQQFIEQFWLRRDPTPDTIDNEYRDDHYARIAYANDHYASGIPGWKTDRGRVYITFGPPDSMDESMPTGGTYQRPTSEGGGTTSVFPFETWRYRYIESLQRQEVMFTFVDSSMSGEYRLALDPSEKDALTHVPGAGLTEYEERYGLDKSERWNTDYAKLGPGMGASGRVNTFDMLENYTNAFRAPEVKYKDLQAIVTTKLSYNTLPFNMRTDAIKVTEETVLTPITISVLTKDFAFQEQDGFQSATGHIYAEIRTVSGRLAQKFEDDIVIGPVAEAIFKDSLDKPRRYQKAVYLSPGQYKIAIVLKDVKSGNVGTVEKGFRVPRFTDGALASSSLILADTIRNIPARQVTGMFILGGAQEVVPNLTEFRRERDLNLWMQLYGLKTDPTTHKPSAEVEFLITRNGREVKKVTENSTEFSGAAQQMTIVKALALAEFDPGEYNVQVKVTDKLADGSVIVQDQKFTVK